MEECVVRHFRAALAACAAFALCFALSGCDVLQRDTYVPASKDAAVSSPVIGEDGVLRVGVNTGNPPLAGLGSERIIGVDVDIAAALADELGLKLSVVDVGSDPASALAGGAVDIVMGIDAVEADGSFWLTESYLPTAVAVFSTSAGAGVPVSGDGSTFAAQVSSKSAWAIGNEFGLDALHSTANLPDAFSALKAGEVTYAAADAIIGLYASHGQDMDVSIVALLTEPAGYAVGVSAANVELQSVIGEAVSKLASNGVIGVIEKKWLGTTVSLDGVPMTAGVALEESTDDSAEGEGDEGEAAEGEGEGEEGGEAEGEGNEAAA